MDQGLKLYIWEDVLVDYSAGMMVALAHDVKEARALIRAQDENVPDDDLAKHPRVTVKPCALVIWGGS